MWKIPKYYQKYLKNRSTPNITNTFLFSIFCRLCGIYYSCLFSRVYSRNTLLHFLYFQKESFFISFQHPNFVSKARRAQSCRIQNSRKSRMSRRRSLGADDEFRLEEIVTIEDEDKANGVKNDNFIKSNTILY